MNLFRSGEHVTRWLDGRRPGTTVEVAVLCDLAHAWWADRLSPAWAPHTREANQQVLRRLGLVGAFWELG